MKSTSVWMGLALAATLVSCPGNLEVKPEDPGNQPVAGASTLELSATVTPWTRGPRVVKANVYTQSVIAIATGSMEATGAFKIKLETPDAAALFSVSAPANCTVNYSVTPTSLRAALVSQLDVATATGLPSGVVLNRNPSADNSQLVVGDKVAAYFYADRDASISANCPPASGNVVAQINLALKKGWNTILVERASGNILRYSNNPLPGDLAWQFVPASGATLKITNAPATLETGKTLALNAAVTEPDGTPTGAPGALIWVSSAPNVASVDSTGKLTALGIGSAQISVSTADAPGTGATANINVYGLEIMGGTFNVDDEKLGLAARVRYVDGTGKVAAQPLDLTLAGPPTWNGGQPLLLKTTLFAVQQGGFKPDYQTLTTEIAAVSGAYTARLDTKPAMMSLGTPARADVFMVFPTGLIQYPRVTSAPRVRVQDNTPALIPFTVNAASKLAVAPNLRFSSDQSATLMLWDPVPNAAFPNEFEIYDLTDNKPVVTRSSVYGNSAGVDSASIDRTHLYQGRVYTYSQTYGVTLTEYNISKTTVLADLRPFVTATDASGGIATGGYTLTLYGENLDADTQVSFGANAVSAKSSQRPGQMQVVVPAGTPGDVKIVVKDKNGLSSSVAPLTFRYYASSEFNAKSPNRLLANTDGTVYFVDNDFATSDNSLVKINAQGVTTRVSLAGLNNAYVQDLALDASGRVWVATTDRLLRINANGTLTEVPLPSGTRIQMFAFGADGQVWIARSDTSKLTRVKPDGTNATDFSLLSGGSPDSSANYEMLLAADENIWFTSQNGLGRVTSSGSITIFTQTSVDNLIASVGGMWVSGYSTLIRVANDGTQTLYSNTCDGRIASSTSDTIWCAGRGYNEGVRLFFTTLRTGATSVTKNVFINTKGNFTGIGGLVADTAGRIWYINGSKVGFIVP